MFELTDEQIAMAEMVREFCENEIAPILKEDDEHEVFRKEIVHAMGELGLCGITTDEEYGGLGLGYTDFCIILEEIGRVSVAYAISIAVTGLPQLILKKFGTPEQKEAWLPGLASGELLGAFALSEADSGSDAGSLKTTATLVGDSYSLTGTKFWITHGGYADIYVVMARTGEPGPRGISAFLVPGDCPGLSFGKPEEKMGCRTSPTVEMVLENVQIPKENLLGSEGEGFRIAMTALDSGRITIGSTSVGLAQAAFEAAAKYATTRRQFDQPIIDFQGVGFMLADMAEKIECARLLVQKTAHLRDSGQPFSHYAAMAKLKATDTAMEVTTDAVQVFGGYGYTREYPVERYMREAKVMQIVEGTNQIQRLVIARHIKKTYSS